MSKTIQYKMFFKDFEQMEKYGMRANELSDPLAGN